MQPVSLPDVARNWLRREERKPYRGGRAVEPDHDWAVVGDLFCRCPFQAAFVRRYGVSWYRTELGREAFDRLRVIDGPPDESWRALSPDGTVRGAAERIRVEDLRGWFEDVDVDYVRRRAAGFGSETDEESERLTVFRPPGATPYVADGNHYATAKALYLLDGGAFAEQPVYLGVVEEESADGGS